MAGLARRLAPAAALGGLALVIVGVADPAIARHTEEADPGGALATAAQEPVTTTDDATTDDATTDDATADGATTVDPEAAPQADAAAATCDTGEEVTGAAVMTQWGPVQVSATVADGQVCEVHAVTWPTNDRKSQMINSYAIPELDAAASQSGTAFDYVSGATYTSEAYRQSLQSLLDAL